MTLVPAVNPAQERAARLQLFIELRYDGNASAFARAAKTTPQRVKAYLEDVQPGADILAGFLDAGLNIIWYLTGLGKMDYVPDLNRTAELAALYQRLIGDLGEETVKRLAVLFKELERFM